MFNNPAIAPLLADLDPAIQQALLLAFPPQDLVERSLASEETIQAYRNCWAAEGVFFLLLWIIYVIVYFVYNPVGFEFLGVFLS